MLRPTTAPSRVFVIISTILVVLVLLLLSAGRADGADGSDAAPAPDAVAEHVVRGGDTLWDIASAVTDPGEDIRGLVDEIRRLNDLPSSLIQPGQVLLVPTG